MKNHIGIIGAGFGGLAAALELHEKGFKVTVLEARQRVGGRVWSTTLPNGEITELGGEWINEKDKLILAMIDRLGLSRAAVGVNFLQRKVIAGTAVSIEEQQAARELAAETQAAMPKADIASGTIGAFISNLPMSAAQKRYYFSRVQISYGIDPHKVALRMIEHYDHSSDNSTNGVGGYYRVASGNMSVAQSIAERLDDVRLGHEVKYVESVEHGVIVRGISADKPFQIGLQGVVIAVPVKVLADFEFNPALPSPIKNAIASVEMGTAAKLTAATRGRPSLRAYHDVETPFWCWTGRGGDGKVRKVVTSFCGSVQSQARLATKSKNPDVWFKYLQSANPDLDFEGDPMMVDWSQDKWARGCYSAFSNQATDNIPYLTKSVESIFFAGEHTAYNSATMDGAIESGLRAAKQVSEELK